MIHIFRHLFIHNRFFWIAGGVAALFVLSFPIPLLFPIAQALLVMLLAGVVADVFLLFRKATKLAADRKLPRLFNLGDPNIVRLSITNRSGLKLALEILDELPVQFQERNFLLKRTLAPGAEETISYELRPVERGAYHFGSVNVYAQSLIGLVQRRFQFQIPAMVPVYPSVVQMKKYELLALARISHLTGIKKIRRIGHSYDFERIKSYVKGDDYRSVNWKATGRRNSLMVNVYEDERAQQVYSLIDKSRSMKMQFNGLSLMDYAINASLVISNIALQKHDKAGLITFSHRPGNIVPADRKRTQLRNILETLYREEEGGLEADYEGMYESLKKIVKGRSLVFLFTNFASYYALERVLPILRRLNKLHLLVVVFFENTEIIDYSEQNVESLQDIYMKTIARKFIYEKYQMLQELRQYGIQPLLTKPEDLSVNTVNKYLELKARGLI